LLAVLKYRSHLIKALSTTIRPWLATAKRTKGLIFTEWHSTRREYHGDSRGASTGRLSSTPNFQNIPKEFEALFAHEEKNLPKAKREGLPKSPMVLPPLPHCRCYVVPFRGDVLLDRDYSQQELRALAHYEDAVLKESYLKNHWLDVHDLAKDLLSTMLKKEIERKKTKTTGFGLIYGMGLGRLAEANSVSVDEAREIKTAYLNIFPGLKELQRDLKTCSKNNEPIRTWGGREYYCEEARVINGRVRTYDYKLLNVLIQGSSADCTKEALIRFMDNKKKSWKVLMTVHDEILISAPKKEAAQAMEALRAAMESVDFDVPMLSEGDWSAKHWDTLEPYDRKGKKI